MSSPMLCFWPLEAVACLSVVLVPGGLMWSIQAVTDPPSNVLTMQHGQVVISARDGMSGLSEPGHQVVGQAKTVQLCLASDAVAPNQIL